MLDGGLGFQLVPWSPSLEKHLGKHVPASPAMMAASTGTLAANEGSASNLSPKGPFNVRHEILWGQILTVF